MILLDVYLLVFRFILSLSLLGDLLSALIVWTAVADVYINKNLCFIGVFEGFFVRFCQGQVFERGFIGKLRNFHLNPTINPSIYFPGLFYGKFQEIFSEYNEQSLKMSFY